MTVAAESGRLAVATICGGIVGFVLADLFHHHAVQGYEKWIKELEGQYSNLVQRTYKENPPPRANETTGQVKHDASLVS